MTVVDRKQREKEQRRNEIVNAAERLFIAKGFDNVSMDEIAGTVDLSKGLLYVYFRNKDSLFFAIVEREEKKSLENLINRMKKPATGGEKLREIVRWYIDIGRANPAYSEMVTIYAPVLWSRMNKDDEEAIRANRAVFYRILNEIISDGIADGSIRNDIDPIMLGFYLTMITMSIVWPLPAWKTAITRVGLSFEDLLDNFLRFIEPAIRGCRDTDFRKSGSN